MFSVSFASKGIRDKIGDWRYHKWVETLKENFNWIDNNRYYMIYFLRGFFDSEGSICFKKAEYGVAIATQDPNANNYICQIMKGLGMNCKQFKLKGTFKSIRITNIPDAKVFASLISSCIRRKERILKKYRDYQI